MTRSQRRIRARKLGQLRAEDRHHALGVNLAENPNSGHRHAAKLAYMEGFVAELAREERNAYRPLTVYTPIKRARVEPKHTSYTV